METLPTKHVNPGNFANNPEKAREVGRKGGKSSKGNFKNNPQRAAECGRKGGKASHGGKLRPLTLAEMSKLGA